jgi:FMN phosphatase YigB (HAD superfamily)
MKKNVSLLVTDLDNTLWDWVHIWHSTFSAYLAKVSEISGIPIAHLEPEFKRVHQKHGTTEYAFSLQEIPVILETCAIEDIKTKYAPAITAFREARTATLRLYPGVLETLRTLKERGCMIVGYTESLAFYSLYRMRQLNIDLVMDFLYSPPAADFPTNMTPEQREQLERYPKDAWIPRGTVHRHTPRGAMKPNPDILRKIIADVGGDIEMTAYVGDSEIKDIAMAQAVGVADVWAKYGTGQAHPGYELLRRVTHWPDRDVSAEKAVVEQRNVKPPSSTYVLDSGFDQVLEPFEWSSFVPKEPATR